MKYIDRVMDRVKERQREILKGEKVKDKKKMSL